MDSNWVVDESGVHRTCGRWRCPVVVDADGHEMVAMVRGDSREQAIRRAKLFAALPAMHKFIENWEHEITDGGVLDKLEGWQREFADEARDILTHAKGGAA